MDEIYLFIVGGVILFGFLGRILFQKTNIPSTLWLVLFGVLLSTFNIISADLLQGASGFISAIAIIGILSDGGMRLSASDVFQHGFWGVAMMIIGFVSSSVGVTLIMMAYGFPFLISFLTALIVGGTSSSVVIPLVTSVTNVSDKFKTILSIESVFDTFTVLFAIVVINASTSGVALQFEEVALIVRETGMVLATTIITSLLFGLLWHPIVAAIRHYKFSYSATLSFFIITYAVHEYVGLSGALAVFFAGIAFANAHHLYNAIRKVTEPSQEGFSHPISKRISKTHSLISFLIRVFFFVYLGLFVQLPELRYFIIGVLATLFICVSRLGYMHLLSVWGGLGFTTKEKYFASILIPRGLSSAVLAIFAVSQGVEYGAEIAQVTVSIIFFSLLASTLGSFLFREKGDKNSKGRLHPVHIQQSFD